MKYFSYLLPTQKVLFTRIWHTFKIYVNNNVIQNTLKLKIGYSHIHTTTDDVENGKKTKSNFNW